MNDADIEPKEDQENDETIWYDEIDQRTLHRRRLETHNHDH